MEQLIIGIRNLAGAGEDSPSSIDRSRRRIEQYFQPFECNAAGGSEHRYKAEVRIAGAEGETKI